MFKSMKGLRLAIAALTITVVSAVGLSSASSLHAGLLDDGCFGCTDSGPNSHEDQSGGANSKSPSNMHGAGIHPYDCYDAHLRYAISAAPLSPKLRGMEVQALVAQVQEAVRLGDVGALAALTRDDARVRVDFARQSIQIMLGRDVVSHSAVDVAVIDAVLAHH